MINSVFVNTQGLYQRRRAFNKSYRNDFTCSLGELIPVYWEDLIPNTSWHVSTHALARFLPMISPIMDNIDIYVHFWQAPQRILLGDGFTDMITGESEDWPGVYFTPEHVLLNVSTELSLPLDDWNVETAATFHYLIGDGSIFDMLGYDFKLFFDADGEPVENKRKLNARKFCMYFRLLRNWYTNENIEPFSGFKSDTEIFDDPNSLADYPTSYDDGDISALIAHIVVGFYNEFDTAGFATHMWPKDYFTAALPTLQYGLPTYLPLGTEAPVKIPQQDVTLGAGVSDGIVMTIPNAGHALSDHYTMEAKGDGSQLNMSAIVNNNHEKVAYLSASMKGQLGDDDDLLIGTADLSEATAITINELRIANALQVFKEREMRYGRRAPEYYKGFFGVTPGDLRLQLPKFLGGGRIPVNISDVEQTSATEAGSPQGHLAGKGTALAAGFAKASTFTAEEALVLGVAWLMPKVTYAHCLSRHDTKINDRFDYYNPSFAHIGEQEVWNYEIFAGVFPGDDKEFGYQPRYTEYRFHANEMHGDFKGNLSYWTLGRIFDDEPALNGKFIYMQPKALNRIFAVREDTAGNTYRNVLCSFKFAVSVIQPLSRYGTPGLLA